MINQAQAAELAPLPPERPAMHYRRFMVSHSERVNGSQIAYDSFADFRKTLEAEANNPKMLGVADMIDVINPLQHLPLISNIYRDITGDQIKPGPRMLGSTLFGGGIGLAASSIDSAVRQDTGHNIAENVAFAFRGNDGNGHGTLPESVTTEMAFAANEGATGTNGAGAADTVTITWDPAPSPSGSSSDIANAASVYRRVASTAPKGETAIQDTVPYERVRMADPERMAGSFARYV